MGHWAIPIRQNVYCCLLEDGLVFRPWKHKQESGVYHNIRSEGRILKKGGVKKGMYYGT